MNERFLIEFGFNENIKNEIIENNSIQMFEALVINETECIKIISYLRKIGIKTIKELLVYRTDLFLNTFKKIETTFQNIDITLINKINEDYSYVDTLL